MYNSLVELRFNLHFLALHQFYSIIKPLNDVKYIKFLCHNIFNATLNSI